MQFVKIAGTCVAIAIAANASGVWAEDAAHDWSGPYVGIQGGYAFGDADQSFSNGAPSDSSDPDGVFGGGHIGFLFQSNQLVFGIEGDIEATDIDGSFQNATGITSSGSTEIDLQGSVRGKLGYAVNEFMPYVTGGLAIADIDYGGGPIGGPCCGFSKTATGWTVGGGVQIAFSDMVSGRVEYRYTDYGTESGGARPFFPSVRIRTDVATHAIMAGVSIHFGGLLGQ